MAIPVTSRQTNRYLGNSDPERDEVHDLRGNNSHCGIDKILKGGNAVVFEPDTLEQAYAEGYLPCSWCIGISAHQQGEAGEPA